MTRPRAGAFTLVEILVVIAIVSVLITILLPALASARESARHTQCLAKLRQWSVALHSYSVDFREWFAAGDDTDSIYIDAYMTNYFGGSRGQYQPLSRMMMCPARSEYVGGQSGSAVDPLAYQYRMQGEWLYFGGHGTLNVAAVNGKADWGGRRYTDRFKNGHKPTPTVNHPFVQEVGASRRVLMADMANYSVSGGQNIPYITAANRIYVNHRRGGDPAKPANMNLLYVDGHGKASPAWTSGEAQWFWSGGTGRVNWVP